MKRTIAIVDDEKDLNELMSRYLQKDGYQVKSYYLFEDAMDNVNDSSVDLWLLDIMLDDGNYGYDLFEAIKKQYPDKPVVFVSARDQEFDRILGLEKGGDDYITKPFNMKEVVLRINNIIKRFYREDSQIEIDGYTIFEKQRKVSDGLQVIELTTKEFDMLMMFVQKKGIALSRDDILNNVWGEEYYGSVRVVDDTLRRLRKKMPNLSINTLYSYGYRLG